MMIKRKRWERFHRIMDIYIVCACYEQFKMMMIHRVVSMAPDWGFNEANSFSQAMNAIFKVDTKTEDFLLNKDSEMNKSIEFYNNFKKIVEESESDYDDMLACCKAIFYNKHWSWINADGYLYMPTYLEALLDYIGNRITKEELEYRFVYFKLWEQGKPSKGNFALVRRTFREVENIIHEVQAKRDKRARKRKESKK